MASEGSETSLYEIFSFHSSSQPRCYIGSPNIPTEFLSHFMYVFKNHLDS